MPRAPFQYPAALGWLPGERTNRAPLGGCWIASGPGGLLAGVEQRPALFYRQGYTLPRGTTEYSILYGITPDGRRVVYSPDSDENTVGPPYEIVFQVGTPRSVREANVEQFRITIRDQLIQGTSSASTNVPFGPFPEFDPNYPEDANEDPFA